MCGICGATNDPDGAAVVAMNRAMVHRGPDDDGTHVDRSTGVAIGARRLKIIDLEGGHQPLANEDRSVWAVLNGEIYNYPALRERLLSRGHDLRTRTDTEVLVHLYEEYGDALVHSLEGMFAFAIWDAEQRRLLVARDRFGEKPLFYIEQGGELAFASELSALTSRTVREPELDPVAVDDFFVFGYVPGPHSIVKQVRQLPQGHLLRWDTRQRRADVSPYWAPPEVVQRRVEPLPELIAETGRLLEDSVRSRMIADVPLGVFLSGGVDSTLIAALAARHSSQPIKTFTVDYDVGDVGEMRAARRVANVLGADHHELVLSQDEAARRVPTLLSRLDQPLADQALVPLHAVAEEARRDVTVAIGGEGADELFGGYPRYRWLSRAERAQSLLPGAAKAIVDQAVARLAPGRRTRRLVRMASSQPMLERQVDWVTADRRYMRGLIYGPLLRERGQEWFEATRVIRDLETRLNGASNGSVAARLMQLDQVHWLPDDVLVKADRAGMLVSLEIRTPYLHRELAEFAGSLSPQIHVGGAGKGLLRGLVKEILPMAPEQRSKKTAFRVPAAQWLRGPLAKPLSDQIRDGAAFNEGWVDRTEITRMVNEHRSGRRDRTDVLWPVLTFGLWLDRFRGHR